MGIEVLSRCREAAETAHLFALLLVSVKIPDCAGVRCQRLDGMPRGGNDETRAAVERFEYYSKLFDEWNKRLAALKAEVENIIVEFMEDEKNLIRLYYCEALTDAGCAARMGWARWQTANEKRNQILQKLRKRLDRIGVDRYNGSG